MSQTPNVQESNDLEDLRKRLHALQNPVADDKSTEAAKPAKPSKPTLASHQAHLDDLERRITLVEDGYLRVRKALRMGEYPRG